MRARNVAVVVVALLATTAAGSARAAAPTATPWKARPATFGVVTETDVPIRMRDGVVLRANVMRPARADGTPAPGRFPVVVTQTPYKKSSSAMSMAMPYLVEHGYVDVVVDIRGTGTSEGTFSGTFSTDEQHDGKEIVEWAARQPGSTGAVGLHGSSYQGINQLLTAAQRPKGLGAIFPVVANGDAYRTNFPGGYLTTLAAFALLYPADGIDLPPVSGDDPLGPARVLGTRPAGVAGALANIGGMALGDDHRYDGPTVQAQSPLSVIDRISTPTFLVGGWRDALSQRDGPLLFRELQRRHVPVKLLMGPWTHTTPGKGLPADGIPTLDELHLRWFDHYLRGVPDPGLASWGPVFLHRAGDGYRRAPGWTVPGVRYREAFLGDGVLTEAPPAAAGADQMVWTPVAGACSGSTDVGTFGLAPQTPCTTDNRANDATALTYDLPLGHDVRLTGPFSAHLFVSTTAQDAHAVLRLEDVAPDGHVTELTWGWDTLSLRALDRARSEIVGGLVVRPHHPYTRSSVLPVRPGEIYEWWVEIRPTSVHLRSGHTLRLAVQTADSARFLPAVPDVARMAGGMVSIHRGARYPSAIVLPIER